MPYSTVRSHIHIYLPNTVHIGVSTVPRRTREQTHEEKEREREGGREGRSIHRSLESGSFGPPRFADRRANPLGSLQAYYHFAVARPHRDLAPPSRGLPTRDSISAPQCASTSCAVNRDAVGKDAVARRCCGSLPPPFAAAAAPPSPRLYLGALLLSSAANWLPVLPEKLCCTTETEREREGRGVGWCWREVAAAYTKRAAGSIFALPRRNVRCSRVKVCFPECEAKSGR